jgi:hypothetical protein
MVKNKLASGGYKLELPFYLKNSIAVNFLVIGKLVLSLVRGTK